MIEFPLNVGMNLDTNQPVYIDPDRVFPTHLEAVGATGSGKTTVLETLLQELFTCGNDRRSFFVISPFPGFIRRLMAFVASPHYCPQSVRDRLVYIEPANTNYTTTLNPLSFDSRPNQDFKVARALDLLLRGFESQDLSLMPRLRRFLHQSLFDISQLGMPLVFIKYLLTPGSDEHEKLVARLPADSQALWQSVLQTHKGRATDYLDSTHNRVSLFNDHIVLKRMFSSPDSLLDIPQFMDQGKIVLINLNLGEGQLHPHAAATIGSVLINEILNHGVTRMNERGKPNDTYLTIDEFQMFLGPDIFDFLPITRQMGIHLLLAHQSFSQLVKGDIDLRPMIAQARSRLLFANDGEDADIMAEEIANLDWDPDEIKRMIQSLRQRIVGHRTEILQSGNRGQSTTRTETRQTKRSSSKSETRPPREYLPTESKGDQYSLGDVTGGSVADSSTEGWSESLIPIYKDFYETSSIQEVSREEIVHKWRQRFRKQPTGHCYFKQVNVSELVHLAVRYLPPDEDQATENAIQELIQKNFEEGPFISADAADQTIARMRDELLTEPPIRITSDDIIRTDVDDRHKTIFDD